MSDSPSDRRLQRERDEDAMNAAYDEARHPLPEELDVSLHSSHAIDVPDLYHQVIAMQQSNDNDLKQFATQGVTIPQEAIVNTRFALLTDYLLGPMETTEGELPSQMRLEFELTVQKKFTELIENVRSQVRQQILMQGIHGTQLPPR